MADQDEAELASITEEDEDSEAEDPTFECFEDDKKDDDGEVLADLGDGVGEAFEVWVGVGAVGDHEEVLDGSPSQVGGGGTGETSLVLR